MRRAKLERNTKETQIAVSVALDGSGEAEISTGVGFFDHMLDQIARHGLLDLDIRAKGDLHIDAHHTIEDVGILLGKTLREALGDRRGVRRYAHAYAPLDEALCRCVLDLSGRSFLVFTGEFPSEKIGSFDVELVREFFQAISANMGASLHVDVLRGVNSHHIAEACFKSFALALRQAIEIDPRRAETIPSTKGVL